MVRAVIFDMFETLITHYNSPLYFGAQMAADAGISEDQFHALWRSTEHNRTIGEMTFEEVVEMILRENNCYSESLLEKIVQKRIAVKEECFRHLHPEIMPMLSKLKEKGILIGLISNCFSEETGVIRKSELFPYFDAAYLSYEQGVAKPDEEIFERCIEKLSVKAEECIYIGDGGSGELEAARKVGMKAVQAVWYLKEGTMQPSGRKHDFPQMETPLAVLDYLENKTRCSWLNLSNAVYVKYHDEEWGRPLYDDRKLYELLILECFQAGLSWECVLNKRENFRAAFDYFDIDKVVKYNDEKIKELLNNPAIIRNRLKVKAAVNNSIVFKAIQKEYGSFSNYIWSFSDHKVISEPFTERTTSPLSDTISKDLKKRGMTFVGSTIIYSFLQAMGIINGHSRDCMFYQEQKEKTGN